MNSVLTHVLWYNRLLGENNFNHATVYGQNKRARDDMCTEWNAVSVPTRVAHYTKGGHENSKK